MIKQETMAMTILWVEGRSSPAPSLLPDLRQKGYEVESVSTGKAAYARLPDLNPDLAIINAASLQSSGRRICRNLRERLDDQPILLIRKKDQKGNGQSTQADLTLTLPFTVRKLVNRIQSLNPKTDGKALSAGPITLYPKCNTVQVNGREPQVLTPRLTDLLKMLIKHAGEVITREDLFREVWETDYVKDTRTLSVHISWLRKEIEDDPRDPQRLKTIRGVGYMLAEKA